MTGRDGVLEFDEGASAHTRGVAVRKQLFGTGNDPRIADRWNAFNEPLREYITDAAFGTVWARPGLDLRTRSAITVAMLTALRAWDELELHTGAALRNGLTAAELREIVLQAAVYVGVPASLEAFGVVERALRGAGVLGEDGLAKEG
jgi:alkylhydroperoxidase/carboxymuconolactone decarboxylase family protein YurZ